MKTWKKKTDRLMIRLSPEDKERMEVLAREEGFDSLSQWARKVLLDAAQKQRPVVGQVERVKRERLQRAANG